MSIPAFITLFYSVKPLHNAITGFLIRHNFYILAKSLEIPIVIILYLLVPLVLGIYNYYKNIIKKGLLLIKSTMSYLIC
jgi:hypothetical protein